MRKILACLMVIFLAEHFCYVSSVSGIQICGRSLADTLALVCGKRGYNMAFRSDAQGDLFGDRRYKRGIVDECCKTKCDYPTLESYCTAVPSNNISIRKRSELSKSWMMDEKLVDSKEKNIGKLSYLNDLQQHHKRRLFAHSENPDQFIYKFGSQPKSYNLYRQRSGNKVKRNGNYQSDASDYSNIPLHESSQFGVPVDTSEVMAELANGQDDITKNMIFGHKNAYHRPIIRHHRDRLSGEKRHHHGHKGKGTQFSQVGTVPPYFLGRKLVSHATRKM